MQQSPHMLFASVLFSTLLPLTVWGYGFSDYPSHSSYLPYAGSVGGNRATESLRVQTGMTEDGYYVRAFVEGLHPEDVQVRIRRNRLVLQVAQGDQYGRYHPSARGVSRWQMRFRRQLRLPYDADWTRMTTSMKNGIMEIVIPRMNRYLSPDPSLQW